MLRVISKKLLRRNNHVVIPANGIAQASPKRPKELNSVKLMGTIEHEIKRLVNGSIKLYLKTLNDDTTYCVHKVAIANSNLLNMVQNRLKLNQRIYIGGRLKTDNKIVENKRHQEVEILANELYFLEPNPSVTENGCQTDQTNGEDQQLPFQMDQNCVEMLAFVGTVVQKERNLSAFSIQTHFTKQKGRPDESEGREYHRVLIYNNPKMIQAAHNLEKFDRIYLTGFINYITRKYPDGVDYTNGYIQPTNLVKLKKFDKNSNII